MKTIVISFIICTIASPVVAQLDAWNAKIMFHSRQGYVDTVEIGCDENGGWGYQAGIDVIDTVLEAPGGIWADDSAFNEGTCANLKKDIKNFVTGVQEFRFQVLDVDSTMYQPPYDYISIDTNEFKFDNGSFKITSLVLRSEQGGYIVYLDNEDWYIYYGIDTLHPEYAYFSLDSFTLRFEYDIFSSCIQSNDNQMQLQLEVGFNYYLGTGIAFQPKREIKVFPNPSSGLFWVKENKDYDRYEIISNAGQFLQSGFLKKIDLASEIDASWLHSGIYFIRLISSWEHVPPLLYKLIIH